MIHGIVAGVLSLAIASPVLARDLEIFFIDVEGGQATLVVTPSGESLLIDAGYGRTSRDPDRIVAAMREAGVERIDYMLATHFHGDHIGGIPELSSRIPIGTFIDYGGPLGTIYGTDRMSVRGFASYEPIRRQHQYLEPSPGDRLPLRGVEATVVSSGGVLLSLPLSGSDQMSDACEGLEDRPADGTENFRSLGIVLRHGAFSFLDVGDLSGNTLFKLVCPLNLIGETSVYLAAHHGDYDAHSPVMYDALKPRAAVLNNGAYRGGDPATVQTALATPGMDLWQLHMSLRAEARNAPEDFIANLDDQDCAGRWIRLTAKEDGSFVLVNGRTGFTRTYPRPDTLHRSLSAQPLHQ